MLVAGAYLTVNSSSNQENDLVSKNIEALSQKEGGGTTVKTCIGLWGSCIGNTKAPYAEIEF